MEIDSFVIYMCLEGNFSVVYDVDQFVKVSKGETVLGSGLLQKHFPHPGKGSTGFGNLYQINIINLETTFFILLAVFFHPRQYIMTDNIRKGRDYSLPYTKPQHKPSG